MWLVTLKIHIQIETCVELLLALSCEALLGSAGFSEGRVASFEVAGTLARLCEGGSTAVDNDPNRHRTQTSILGFRISETIAKKKIERKNESAMNFPR